MDVARGCERSDVRSVVRGPSLSTDLSVPGAEQGRSNYSIVVFGMYMGVLLMDVNHIASSMISTRQVRPPAVSGFYLLVSLTVYTKQYNNMDIFGPGELSTKLNKLCTHRGDKSRRELQYVC